MDFKASRLVEHRGVEPRLASLGEVRNSRSATLTVAELVCSPRFRFASACGRQPTGLTLSSAPLQCFALYSAGDAVPDVIPQNKTTREGGFVLWSIGESNP